MAPKHILIVEDEPNTAEMLSSYFEAQGYQVTTVGWGNDALAFTEKTLPDMVVLDIRLPDIDGYEVCRQLRSHRRTARVPIIFLTERRERIDRLAGLELGAVDYVTKPFDIQELRLRVRNVLRRASLQSINHPVTGLPFSAFVEEQLTILIKEAKSPWALLGVSLEGLERFSDVYGFVARDDVLRAMALLVQRVAFEGAVKEPFVGQWDNLGFLVITTPEHARRMIEQLGGRLREALAFFYPRADWESGKDRSGEPLPRLTIEMGMISGPGTFNSLKELRDTLKGAMTHSV